MPIVLSRRVAAAPRVARAKRKAPARGLNSDGALSPRVRDNALRFYCGNGA